MLMTDSEKADAFLDHFAAVYIDNSADCTSHESQHDNPENADASSLDDIVFTEEIVFSKLRSAPPRTHSCEMWGRGSSARRATSRQQIF